MTTLEVLSKSTGKLLESSDNGTVFLKQDSIVKIKASIDDVLNFEREGNSLVINLNNGEKIVIESYFDDPVNSHHVLFEDNNQLYWAEFTDAANNIAESIKYYPIEDLSAVLGAASSTSFTGIAPWLIGAGLAAGVIAIADNMTSSHKSKGTDNPDPEPPYNELLEDAKKALDDAKEAYEKLKDLIEEKNQDGLISPAERAELENALKDAQDAKDAAQDQIDKLPNNSDKAGLQDQLDELIDPTLPEINDQNDDDIPDDINQAIEDAEAAVEAAEDAYTAAENALTEANSNGLITPTEKAALEQALADAQAAKEFAQGQVNALPESVQEAKDGLQARLDELEDITIPAVTDEDEDGIPDDINHAIEDAEAAVEAAEDAYTAAENALTEANSNGLITPTEKAALDQALADAQAAKEFAQGKVNALPESVQESKDGLQARLDELEDITIPAVTDEDEDGIPDDINQAIEDAEAAVEAAEDAYTAAENALTEANSNGLITPTEKAALEQALVDAQAAKEFAQGKVNALPESVQEAKDGLQARLDELEDITIPAVTDEDEDGIPDDINQAIEDAEAAVEAAEDAYTAAENALTEANSNGLITPTEKAALEQALADAQAAKEFAQGKVNALPESVQEAKDGLQARLDELEDITIPAVTDEDEDGIPDDINQAIEDAEAAVEAAEDAYTAAENALTEANSNGLITPTEKAALEQALADAQAAKEFAQGQVNALPESVQEAKDGLQARLDELEDITIPAVTDEDEDGIPDDINQAIEDAEAAVEAAEDAYTAAENALTEANSNGLITPTEKAALEQALADAQAAKEFAQGKVNALPESVQEAKDGLQARLDELEDITIPAVTDEDEDGIPDDINQAIEDAEAAVEAAEDAYTAAENALTEANSNGLITPTEKAALEQALVDAQAAKEFAQGKVNALPESVQEAKDGLQARLDELEDITIPAVTDEDEDGIPDDINQAIEDAEAAVEAAEDAYTAAENALTEANSNGLITPTEKAALEQALADAQAAKEFAQGKVNALPESVQEAKDGLQDRLDGLTDITIPAVNDANENDRDDAEDYAEAILAVEAAEDAYRIADGALADAEGNGLITPTEKAALEQALADAQAAKQAAQTLVDDLPEGTTKGSLQERLNDLIDIAIPDVNDEDDNGVIDDLEKALEAAETAVAEAEEKYEAAEKALEIAQKDGLINPTELAALENALQQAQAAKEAAQTKVDVLPDSVQETKDALQERLDNLTDITLPTINDEDGDGELDGLREAIAEADAAVKEAEEKYAEAKDALQLALNDGLINPLELSLLEQKVAEAQTAKDAAQAKVDVLPEIAEKVGLQDRLDNLPDITLPAVNDQDGDGVADSEEEKIEAAQLAVDAAKAAYEAAEAAIEGIDSNENGLITPVERQVALDAVAEAERLKAEAQELVDGLLPSEAKTELNAELAGLTPLDVPAVTDANDDGVADSEEEKIEAAQLAVDAAKAAYEAAEAAIEGIDSNENGLITPAERQVALDAVAEAERLKAEAQELVDGLLPSEAKTELNAELAGLTPLDVPAVTDANDDGVADSEEEKIEAAQLAVDAAKAAYEAAEAAIEGIDSNENGLITPAERQVALDAVAEAERLKAEAQELVDGLLPSEAKTELNAELAGLTPLDVPAVTDANDDGVADSEEEKIEAAQLAVDAAKAAYEAAEAAIEGIDSNENGLITPAERQVALDAVAEAERLKAEAQELVDGLLPSEAKTELNAELAGLTPLDVPAVTDANDDGVADSEEEKIEAAQLAVDAAKAAYEAAEAAIEGIDSNENGLITPAERQVALDAVAEAERLKAEAQELVDGLLPSEAKTELNAELAGLTPLDVPAVTDANDDGVADSEEEKIEAAQLAVDAAKAAYEAAEAAIEGIDSNENGLITPAERQVALDAVAEAERLKAEAQELVDGLLPSEAKTELNAELAGLTPLDVPAVTDANDDGVADSEEEKIEAAQLAVDAAKAAYEAAEAAIEGIDSNENGLITPAERQVALDAVAEAERLKAEAQELVDGLLPSEAKTELNAELAGLTPLDVPAVTDANDDGVADSEEEKIEAAQLAVDAAKAAYEAAEAAIEGIDSNENGLITPAERQVALDAVAEAERLKAEAQELVDGLLPSEAKTELNAELAGLTPLDVPAVTDANDDGVADSEEEKIEAAQLAVDAAKAAYEAAEAAIEGIDSNENGLITPAERQVALDAVAEAERLKAEAQELVDGLLPSEAKTELNAELAGLTPLDVPAVTDANENDRDDELEYAEAEAKVQEAEDAFAALKQALEDAYDDDMITAAELEQLESDLADAQQARQEAQDLVDNLPSGDRKDELQNRLNKLEDIDLPDADEVFVAADNDVQLVLDITPTENRNSTPSELNSTGFTVGALSLGPVLNASVLESVLSSSVRLIVDEGTGRKISFNADAGGLTVGSMDLYLYKLNEATGEWEQKESIENWYTVVLGGVSETITRELDEGEWLIVLGNGAGLSLVSGYTLRFSEDVVLDYENPVSVEGTTTGNVITDIDYQNGQDVVPENTKVTAVTNSENETIQITNDPITIQGKYGVLTINPDGSYSYSVDEAFRAYGEIDSFTYEITAPNGEKATANLNIELSRYPSDEEAIIDNTVILEVEPTITTTNGDEIPTATAINLLDLGVAGDVLSASVIGTEGVMNFSVEDGTTQDITFNGSAGGLTVLSSYSLIIYKQINDDILQQVHEIPNFVQVLLLGGVAQEVTLSFGEGTYVGVIKQTSGVNVIGGASAEVTQVITYDYNNPKSITGIVDGDVTPEVTDKVVKVNGALFEDQTVVTVQGKYGSLQLSQDGTYLYTVNSEIDTPPYGEIERFEVVVEKANGKSVIEVLNIQLDINKPENDFNVVTITADNASIRTAASDTATVKLTLDGDEFAEKLKLEGTVSRTNLLNSPSSIKVTIKQVVDGVEQTVYENASIPLSWSGFNASYSTSDIINQLGGNFTAGEYTVSLEVNVSGTNTVNVTAASLTGTVFNDVTYIEAPIIAGNILNNDTGVNQIDILKIGSKELYINDAVKGGQNFTVQGKYGVLTLNKDGSYTYQASGDNGGVETFTYTTISKAGSEQTATLQINVGLNIAGNDQAEIVKATASIDTFTLKGGADTVVYDVLNQVQDSGKPDLWTDFSIEDGDKIDISALLNGQNVTEDNVDQYVTLSEVDGNTVVNLDMDGEGSKYEAVPLIILPNISSTIDVWNDLLKHNNPL